MYDEYGTIGRLDASSEYRALQREPEIVIDPRPVADGTAIEAMFRRVRVTLDRRETVVVR